MKKLLLFFFQLVSLTLLSQTPQLINYQGIARDGSGLPVTGKIIGIRFELKQNNAPVFAETQTVSTGDHGLFTTQIGKLQGSALSAINWNNGAVTLNTFIDINNDGTFVDLGAQSLASVPFALNAKTVPSSISGNSLTIGSETHELPAGITYTNGSGIGITGTVITNTAPDVTITLQQGTNINVTGTYPNFTVSSNPQLFYSGDSLNISGGNTVTIAPTLGVTGNTLRVGPSSNSIALPSSPVTFTGTGIANITPLTGTSFTVDVAPATFTAAGPVTITGVHPNYTVNSPVTPSVNATGIASITSGAPNYNVNVPAPQFGNNGPVTISGTYPNLTVNSPTVPPATTFTADAAGIATVSSGPNYTLGVRTPTFSNNGPVLMSGTYPNYTLVSPATPTVTQSSAGIATVSTGPNFVVGVQTPSWSSTGPSSITGTWPNLTITSPTVPPATTVTADGAGIATVSAGPNFTIGVRTPTFSNNGPVLMSGAHPNYTLVSPATPTVTQSSAGIATVSAGPNYIVGVQTPTWSSTGPSSITGTWPNLTITSPTVPPSTTVTADATGIATVSAGPNFTIGVRTPSFSNNGPVIMSGAFPNYTLVSPATPTVSQSSAGIATVSAGPNFVVGVQTPTFTSVGPSSITGTYPNLTITSPTVPPTTTIVAAPGIATVSAGPNFTVGVQTPVFTSAGITTISGTYPNLTVTSPSPVIVGTGATTVTSGPYPNYSINTFTPNITGGGITTVSGAFPNYVVTTPPTQMTLTGTGLASVTPATPGQSFNVDVPVPVYTSSVSELTFGTNTVLINPLLSFSDSVLRVGSSTNTVALPWALNGGTVALSNSTNHVGIGTYTPVSLLDIDAQSGTAHGLIVRNARDISGGALPLHIMANTSGQTYGTNTFGRMLRLTNTTQSQSYDFGIDNTGGLFLTHNTNYSTPFLVMTPGGNIGVGTTSPIRKFEVAPGGNTLNDDEGQASFFHNSGTGNAILAQSNSGGNITTTTTIYADAMLAGYNTTTPFGLVDVGVWGIGRGITSSYGIVAQNGAPGAATTYVGLGGNTYSGIFMGGNVGIGTNAPTETLEVAGTVKIADGTQGAGKVLTSNAAGNASWQLGPGTQVCYLKDVKGSGASGGSFSSGSWITRTLNTVEGTTSFVNLAANQFTLQAGVYDIYAEAPAHNVSNNKIKLYNVTDNTDDIIGSFSQAVGVGVCIKATLMGRITITSPKSFAIQHRCSLTQFSDGFGSANSFGVSEIFTQVKITKIN